MNKTIFVYADWFDDKPRRIGTLYSIIARGHESFSFEYDDEWLMSESSGEILDYDLQPYTGRQYLPDDKPVFGMFADSCPDRWGRLLMQRRETMLAAED